MPGILFWVVFIVWGVYAAWITQFMHKILTKKLAYLSKPDPNLQASCQTASRYDFSNVKPWKVYLGLIFLLPIRVLLALPLLAILYLLVSIPKNILGVTVKTNQIPRSKLYVQWVVGVFVLMRPLLWCLGITSVTYRYLRIKDVFADYVDYHPEVKQAPIVVSNHTSWLDMFFYLSKNVSFLSKDTVARVPMVGMHAIARQCIFLDRTSTDDRNASMDLIKKRVERVKNYGDVSPLLIFPEGTVSNGRSLMSFKKGAFVTGDKIKIYALKYNSAPLQFICSISNMNALFTVLLGMSQWTNPLEVYEYEDNFDPYYVYRKYSIDPSDENAWVEVSKQVKTLMAFAAGLECTEVSTREAKAFETTSAEYNKRVLSQSI